MIHGGKIINCRLFETDGHLEVEIHDRLDDAELQFNDFVTVIQGPEVYVPESYAHDLIEDATRRLSAVRALHSPRQRFVPDGSGAVVGYCAECQQVQPCATIQALDKENP